MKNLTKAALIINLILLISCGSEEKLSQKEQYENPGQLDVISAEVRGDDSSWIEVENMTFNTHLFDDHIAAYGWTFLVNYSEKPIDKCDPSTGQTSGNIDFMTFYDVPEGNYYVRICALNKETRFVSKGIQREVYVPKHYYDQIMDKYEDE